MKVECVGCVNRIDPDTCWCGAAKIDHFFVEDHPFVPLGCDCHRQPVENVRLVAPEVTREKVASQAGKVLSLTWAARKWALDHPRQVKELRGILNALATEAQVLHTMTEMLP